MPDVPVPPVSSLMSREALFKKILGHELSAEVVKLLCPHGKALDTEGALFDYKRELPHLPADRKPSEDEKRLYNEKMNEIVKDCVAFHNSFGGYLLAGVDNSSRLVLGYDRPFCYEDLNKKIQSYTGVSIDCSYERLHAPAAHGGVMVGLLLIPRRADGERPVQFIQSCPVASNGKQPFKRKDIFFRLRDQSIAAETSYDLEFLFSKHRRYINFTHRLQETAVLGNNLPQQEHSLAPFVGRDIYLNKLWQWFFDRYNRVKILTGMGGIGKTSIARKFAEDVITNATVGVDAVIWLGAKRKRFSASRGMYVNTSRVDFTDRRSLYEALLNELGVLEDWEADSDAVADVEPLIDRLIEYLSWLPCLVIIDDLDSLDTDAQRWIFQDLNNISSRVHGASQNQTRFLITSRLELGASQAQLLKIMGLNLLEFVEYVNLCSGRLALDLQLRPDTALSANFYSVSGGSPLFANSILRLVSLGDNLNSALRAWRGADGVEVRRAAFEKELGLLSAAGLRTLYAASLLGETDIDELAGVTELTRRSVQDTVDELKGLNFVGVEGNPEIRLRRIVVPRNVRMMDGIVKDNIPDPKVIEKACDRARSLSPRENQNQELAKLTGRVIAHWRANEPRYAVELCVSQRKQYRNNPDFRCLIGRAYLRLTPPHAHDADREFRQAHRLGCERPELYDLWVAAKEIIQDWHGVIDVSRMADGSGERPENVLTRAQAYLRIGKINAEKGKFGDAAARYLQGAEDIHKVFNAGKAYNRVPELRDLQKELMWKYVDALATEFVDPDEHIEVWMGCFKAFEINVRNLPLLELGSRKLASWWAAVERRHEALTRSADKLSKQLINLEKVLMWAETLAEPPPKFRAELTKILSDLRVRESLYRASCDPALSG